MFWLIKLGVWSGVCVSDITVKKVHCIADLRTVLLFLLCIAAAIIAVIAIDNVVCCAVM